MVVTHSAGSDTPQHLSAQGSAIYNASRRASYEFFA